jgi:hypothetical protein
VPQSEDRGSSTCRVEVEAHENHLENDTFSSEVEAHENHLEDDTCSVCGVSISGNDFSQISLKKVGS